MNVFRGKSGVILLASIGVAVAVSMALGVAIFYGVKSMINKVDSKPLDPLETATASTQIPDGSQRFYDQTLQWEDCRPGSECASIKVPMDWNNPQGPEITIALVKIAATDSRKKIGSLLLNPGGPGASGISFVEQRAVGPDLMESFDLIGFDPRGVGESSPVDCVDDQKLDDYIAYDPDPETPEGLQEWRTVSADFAKACQSNTGTRLGFVDTVSAARDMDVIRHLVGDERLNYLGFSYGTLLGATYAGLYPGRVGRMALDSALDPRLDYGSLIVGQAKGLDLAITNYMKDCQKQPSSCPFSGSLDDGLKQLRDFFAAVDEKPLPTSDPSRPLTVTLAFYGVIVTTYSPESWPLLSQAMESGLAGDGTALLNLSDQYNDRDQGKYTTNGTEAFAAINCLDYSVDDSPEAMKKLAETMAKEAPVFGPLMTYGEVSCGAWPVKPTRPSEAITASGAPPILVVGTTGDQATPVQWAKALAEQLESGVFLKFEGEGHGAFFHSQCVKDAVQDYLVGKAIPQDGQTC